MGDRETTFAYIPTKKGRENSCDTNHCDRPHAVFGDVQDRQPMRLRVSGLENQMMSSQFMVCVLDGIVVHTVGNL